MEPETRIIERDKVELDPKITALIAKHQALSTALEIKNALGTVILNMDESLNRMLKFQKQIQNLQGRVTGLERSMKTIEFNFELVEPQTDASINKPRRAAGKPLK